MNVKIPQALFGMSLEVTKDTAATKLPRVITDDFEIRLMQFGVQKQVCCHALFPKNKPGMKSIRAAIKAFGRIDNLPVALIWQGLSYAQKDSLSREGISYVQDERNAFLPFLGAVCSSLDTVAPPTVLLPQTQRLLLNYLSGRWIDCNAGDVAKLAGKSRASVTKYFSELTAICPGIVLKEGKSSYLRRSLRSKEELLDLFEPYLLNPIAKIHCFVGNVNRDILHDCGARLAGTSELAALTDLAENNSVLEVAMDTPALLKFQDRHDVSLVEAGWNDEASLVIYEWTYPIDGFRDELIPVYGLSGLDVENLYVMMKMSDYHEVRVLDAIDQVRELVCQ